MTRLRFPAFVSAAIFLLCELIARPFAEMGIADDWSYIRTADILAGNGHIAYNGWATAMVGWQLYLGAAFFRIFGFSFTVARTLTLLIACLTVFLLQRTLVRLGLNERNATLGTLTFALSPLFMMLSVTFMTDVPGFFAILLCLYACIRALHTTSDRNAVLWVAFAVLSNCICGSSRQIAWLGVLVLVPSTLYLLRSRRAVLVPGLAITAAGYLCIFAAVHWFSHQLYAPSSEAILPSHVNMRLIAHLLLQLIHALVIIFLLLLPVTLVVCLRLSQLRRGTIAALALACIAVIALYLVRPAVTLGWHFEPLLGDWVSVYATYQNSHLVGMQPVVIGRFAHNILRLVGVGGLVVMSLVFEGHLSARGRPANQIPPAMTGPSSHQSFAWTQYFIFLGPLFVIYCLLLVRRAEQTIFDRYLLTPIFLLLFFLLLYLQRTLRQRLPTASFAVVAVVAAFGICSTHNLFALARARVIMVDRLQAAGIPPLDVDLGWEQNGWYELQKYPYIDFPTVIPRSPSHPGLPDMKFPGCRESGPFTPTRNLAPRFGLSFDPNACKGLAPFAPVQYRTWPLPGRTTLYVVAYPPPEPIKDDSTPQGAESSSR